MAPPLREICDSEDEDEILQASPHLSKSGARVATSSRGEVVPPDGEMQTSDPSTSSTGEQLRQAHLDLMRPTQDVINAGTSVGSASPKAARPKRRLTGTDAATQPPPSSLHKLKRIKTSPASSSHILTESAIAGAPAPQLGHLPPSANVPGDTIPFTDTAIEPVQATPSTRARRISSQQTPAIEQSSNLTPWSVSAGNSSALHEPPAHSSALQANNSDSLPSDDTLIGLPAEAYQPRPSRSRSEKANLDGPTDFSVRPEKAAKAKRARTIAHSPFETGGEQETGPCIFPDRLILLAPEFEALSPPLPGHEQTDMVPVPDFAGVNEMPLESVPDTASPAPATQKPLTAAAAKRAKSAAVKANKPPAKRGRPRKHPLPVASEEVDELLNDEISVHPSPKHHSKDGSVGNVQVVIPPYSPHDREGDSRVKSILDALNERFPRKASAEPVSSEGDQIKVASAEMIEAESQGQAEIEVEKSEPLPENIPVKRLTAKQAKAASKAETKAAALDLATKQALTHALEEEPEQPPSDRQEDEEETPDKVPSIPAKPASIARSSPLPGIKMGPKYRVGLSRTQRMPSLLKVMRK